MIISGDLNYTSYIKQFTIDFVNPMGAANLYYFYVYYYASDGTELAASSDLYYSTTAGYCNLTTATRTSLTIGASSTFILTFSCQHDIAYNGEVYIYIPEYQFYNPYYNVACYD